MKQKRKAWNKGISMWKDKEHPRGMSGKIPWNKGKTGLQVAWNKGISSSEEVRKKISISKKGVKFSKQAKINMSNARKGRIVSKETREKISKSLIGKRKGIRVSKKTEFKKGQFSGEKNPNWNGGSSFEPYSPEFNKVLKRKIRKRDKFTCQLCFKSENTFKHKLAIHHIDYNKKNNSEDNLISLCKKCHAYTTFNRKDWIKHFKEKSAALS